MIKSLRKRFILVAMGSIFLVLAVIMGTVNIVNYCRMLNKADDMITLLAENDGKFSDPFLVDEGRRKRKPGREGVSPETPYETRFFSVTLDEEGNVLLVDVNKIAATSEEDAREYALKIFEKKYVKGLEGVYRYQMVTDGKNTKIIFLDCRQEISVFQASLFTSISVSVFGLLAVLILVIIFSKMVFRPVTESYEKQRQFITDASHEIKTPLTIIDANTEVLEMENGENQWTKSTRNQVKRLTSLTQQLITLSKMDEGKNILEKTEFSLSDAVLEGVRSFEAVIKMQNKKMNTDIEEDIFYLGDEREIRQLTGILMDNAVKYSIDGGRIQITLKRRGKKIQLKIFNEAESIPKGKQDILFERFYRLDNSRNSETGGSGIGLSVAKAIVISHKGKISAYSTDGNSLTIEVILHNNYNF